MTTEYVYREDGCDRCGTTEVATHKFSPDYGEKEDRHLCEFCASTAFGNIIKYPNQHSRVDVSLVQGLIQSFHILTREPKPIMMDAETAAIRTPEKACADMLEYLWQHGYLDRSDAQHFDKIYGDGTVGFRGQ